ncbi:hypothetical protein ASU33_20850 [Solirubrum puertoriconensis]|uniref:Restriction endonuclease n=1 Tax=Solirubrum puertoriconensis TaxID=1751427 RepID=A0A9X0HND3_SOLP1|nr:hypothetical protein ASU33_20850 [Solirubrum puertoriconensis]
MSASEQEQRIRRIADALPKLSEGQALWVEDMLMQFARPHSFKANPHSDIITQRFLYDFGDTLRVHHCFSKQAFTKDKFEYVFERIALLCGLPAKLATKGNPGFDIIVAGQKLSLKTEAHEGINADKIHISKFMELGKPKWTNDPADLIGLRQVFLDRVNECDRVFTLRVLSKLPNKWHYELVEIPKALLLSAATGQLEMKTKSKQTGALPGYCYVKDARGHLLFELYFDGGSERKLRVQKLLKSSCVVHATWVFSTEDVLSDDNQATGQLSLM